MEVLQALRSTLVLLLVLCPPLHAFNAGEGRGLDGDRIYEDKQAAEMVGMHRVVPRATPAASPPPLCLYVATLEAQLTTGKVALRGSVAAVNDSGLVQAVFNATPLAVAIDTVSATLFVAGFTNIQEYNIQANLAGGEQSCPCSFSVGVGDDVIQTMAVDQARERLFFAYGSELCYRSIGGEKDIHCTAFSLPDDQSFRFIFVPRDGDTLYATLDEDPSVYAITIADGTGFLSTASVWNTQLANTTFQGITMGANGNLFLLSPILPTQPCAVVEMSAVNGSVVSCFDPPIDKQPFFNKVYGLTYHPNTQLFYTFYPSQNESFEVQSFDLVPSSVSGQLNNTEINSFVKLSNTPVDFALGACPQPPSSPSPSPDDSSIDKTPIIVPVVVGSTAILLATAIAVAAVCLLLVRRRRKYFDVEPDDDKEKGTAMMPVKYTFREINSNDLRLGKLLGEGAFGKVYKGEYRGAVVAVKMFETLRLSSTDELVMNELRSEAQMMERLSNHPNIVKFVGAITSGGEGTNFALVTEFCPRGSLYDLLVKKKKKLPLITLVRMARDAAAGILHLHREHIVHRDIAARNILVGQHYEVYVSDFGLARVKEAEGQAATTKQSFGPIGWMAPEALTSREYSEATDAFSFGVLLWEMMARKRPWGSSEPAKIISSVTNNGRLRIPADCDPIFAQLIKMCWRQNPSQRPSFDKISDTLSGYYKKLHKLHDVDDDLLDVSDQDSQDEFEDADDEELSYEDWKVKRLKGEIKSFLKQLISERNDDLTIVAKAQQEAFTELSATLGGCSDSDDDDDDDGEDMGTTIKDDIHRTVSIPTIATGTRRPGDAPIIVPTYSTTTMSQASTSLSVPTSAYSSLQNGELTHATHSPSGHQTNQEATTRKAEHGYLQIAPVVSESESEAPKSESVVPPPALPQQSSTTYMLLV